MHLQELQLLANLNYTTKRHQKDLNVNPLPRLDLSSSARDYNTTSKAIVGQFKAFEREARIQRIIIYNFANTIK